MTTTPRTGGDTPDPRPLIAHVIYRLGIGGLENGVVNLVNRLPAEHFRHAIVCLTEADENFRERIQRDDVSVHAIYKRPGHDLGAWGRLYRLFRQLRPAVVHTRNLGTLEAQIPAFLARVPVRIHGEHGWDTSDPDGSSRKYQLVRRSHAPLVHRFVPLSQELERYLTDRVGIAPAKVSRLYNGVDTERFAPGLDRAVLPAGFAPEGSVVMGTVGRMHGVKDQLTLVRAFLKLREQSPELAAAARLVLVGDGPLRAECQALLDEAGAAAAAWLPGPRDDVPAVLRALDLFVLPSTAEGISNTILEAMASGLPVVATAVGGNGELVEDGVTGALVPPSDPRAMAEALAAYVADPAARLHAGQAGRERADKTFSLAGMLARYTSLYQNELSARGVA